MPDAPDALMLFAAGLGTRMGPLTKELPKPLLALAGRPLIDHAFDLVDAAGIGTSVMNLHFHGDQIRQHLADRRNVAFADESARLLETGGGLKAALPLMPGESEWNLRALN